MTCGRAGRMATGKAAESLVVLFLETETSLAVVDGAARTHGPVGIIVNPRSLRNRRGAGTPWSVMKADVHVAVPESSEQLVEALAEFARREVATVVVDGGDGTVRDVLTALAGVFGTSQPSLAVMPSGNTNLVARNVGGIPPGPAGLDRLLQGLAGDHPLRQTLQPALDVTWPDAPERFVRGTLFGTAAFSRGTELARQSLHSIGINHGPAVALAMTGVLGSTLFGSVRRRLFAGEPMSIRVDGGPAVTGSHFLVMATSLDRMMFGLWPFAEIGEGSLNWLDITAPPRGLLRIAAAALRGRSSSRLRKYGHGSGRAREVAIKLSHPFIVDGDPFEPSEAGVHLTASPRLRFLSI